MGLCWNKARLATRNNKHILHEQCKTEDDKCKIAKEITEDIVSRECNDPLKTNGIVDRIKEAFERINELEENLKEELETLNKRKEEYKKEWKREEEKWGITRARAENWIGLICLVESNMSDEIRRFRETKKKILEPLLSEATLEASLRKYGTNQAIVNK